MAMSVVYATVNGRMVQENRGGTITRYVADPLGSVIQTRNASGVQTSSTTYWPYGEVRTSTGTNPSPWGFVGTLGYFRDALSRLYIRARYYIASIGRWNTVDPLWPDESPYAYADMQPSAVVDPLGRQSQLKCFALIPPGSWPSWIGDKTIRHCYGFPASECMCRAVFYADSFKPGIPTGVRNNAVRHCFSACLVEAFCGPDGSTQWNRREDPDYNWKCRLLPGPCDMDRNNNGLGFGIARRLPTPQSFHGIVAACWDGCNVLKSPPLIY